jgi:hypothetical protein
LHHSILNSDNIPGEPEEGGEEEEREGGCPIRERDSGKRKKVPLESVSEISRDNQRRRRRWGVGSDPVPQPTTHHSFIHSNSD